MAGFASAAALTLGTFAGTGTTYAAFSDFAVISGEARAGVWGPVTPPDTELRAMCAIKEQHFDGYQVIPLTDDDNEHAIGNQKQIVLGFGGNDRITGDSRDKNNAPDCLLGGPGNDFLDGGNGPGVLNGGAGEDTCIGGPSATFIDCEHTERTKNSQAGVMQEMVQPMLMGSGGDKGLSDEDIDPVAEDAPVKTDTPSASETPESEGPVEKAEESEPEEVESSGPAEPTPSAEATDDPTPSAEAEPDIPAE